MVVDEVAGRQAFAAAAEVVLNHSGAGWCQGLQIYKTQMRELLNDAPAMLMQARHAGFQASDPADQVRLNGANLAYDRRRHSTSVYPGFQRAERIDTELIAAIDARQQSTMIQAWNHK